jgi:aspartyl-tRNA(Asn)/glutamyl-tRNA(Gln) amidotransferase subunit C
MPLTLDDVSRIAQLARLELQPAEQAAMLTQLNGFFRVVGQMSAVDTSGVEPLYTPLSAVQDVQLRLRDDAVTETPGIDERNLNQRSAPAIEDGLFLVPKVMVA